MCLPGTFGGCRRGRTTYIALLSGFTESAIFSTKLGGDEAAETEDDAGGDGKTLTTTFWDTETDVSEADVVTSADP